MLLQWLSLLPLCLPMLLLLHYLLLLRMLPLSSLRVPLLLLVPLPRLLLKLLP